MQKAYFKLDAWILTKIQVGYLWLLDRTGVYVASLGFSIYAVIGLAEVLDGGWGWLWCLFIVAVGLSLAPRYLMQDKGENNRFNAIAMELTGWRWRHVLTIFLWDITLLALVTLHPWSALANLGFVIYGYLLLVLIRDRDKKPFFKPVEKQELAIDGAN